MGRCRDLFAFPSANAASDPRPCPGGASGNVLCRRLCAQGAQSRLAGTAELTGLGVEDLAPAGAPVGVPSSTHLPLNNGCSRVVNHFAPTCATAKKHVNIEREKLAAGGGTAAPNHYHDDIDTEEEEHENGKK